MKLKRGTSVSQAQLNPQQMVHWFVASCYGSGSFTEERVRNSIALLRHVPAARNAVLQRMTLLFEEAIRLQLDQKEFQTTASGIGTDHVSSLEFVTETLLNLLEENSRAWASILSNWAVQSLGQISSCYKKRQIVPSSNNLVQLLSFWVNVVPMRMLLDVYRTSLKILFQSEPDCCVDSLLSASQNHSPYFDWVVADVGNEFPDIIIEKVLYSGFNKFSKLRWTSISSSLSASVTMNENEQTILSSVIKMFDHLSVKHQTEICQKMLAIFKNPPQSDKMFGKIKVCLYLMNLFSMSKKLLQYTTDLFVQHIDGPTLNALQKQFTAISRGPAEFETLCSLVVHLVCQSSNGSYKLVQLLMDASNSNMENIDKEVSIQISTIVPLLLKDLKQLALAKKTDPKTDQSIFDELYNYHENICSNLITASPEKKSTLNSLCVSVCLYKNSHCVLGYLLRECSKNSHLQLFVDLYSNIQPLIPDLLENILIEVVSTIRKLTDAKIVSFLTNVKYLLSSDMGSSISCRLAKSLNIMVSNLISMMSSMRSSDDLLATCCELIFIFSSKISISPERVLKTTQALAFCFFRFLHSGHVNNDKAMLSGQKCFVHISQTPETFAVVSRFLLEGALNEENNVLFGRKIEPELEEIPNAKRINGDHRVSLLQIHKKMSTRAAVQRKDGFVPISVETGIIGKGPKRKKKCPISLMAQTSNNACISLLLMRCCCKTSGGLNLQDMTILDRAYAFDSDKLVILSDCLVSTISSASTYLTTALTLDGGKEWPALHMRKFTIERDLKVFHFMDEHPFMFELFGLLAHNIQAIWNMSSVLRSCVSVVLTHLESNRSNEALSDTSLHFQVAVKFVQIAKKGQFLPVPLCYIGDLFHLITPYEMFVLMAMAWNFIKDHPPTAIGDTRLSAQEGRNFSDEKINIQPYITTVQTVLHANIAKLGFLYSRFSMPDVQ